MKIGGPNNVNGPRCVYGNGQKPPDSRPVAAAAGDGGDKVEISDAARLSAAMSRLPEIRGDKVERARQMIADGTLDTPENIETAIDRMIDDMPQSL